MRVSELLNIVYTEYKKITGRVTADAVDLTQIEQNVRELAALKKIASQIADLNRRIVTETEKINLAVTAQINTAKVRIDRLVTEKPAPPPGIVEIAPKVNVRAKFVENVEDARNFRGMLCYCAKLSIFCLNIDSYLFCGKVGDIIPKHRKPRFFREHVGSGDDMETLARTTFYISPFVNPASKHIRTWTNKMCYVSATRALKPEEECAFRIGSRENLAEDLLNIEDEDARLAADYFMSLFLVLITMAQHKKV